MRRLGGHPVWSLSDVEARVEAIAQRVGRPMRFTPETTALIVVALRFYGREGLAERGLTYTVDRWDKTGSTLMEHLATTSSLALAQAAYEAARTARPNDHLTLRHGIRMVRQSGTD